MEIKGPGQPPLPPSNPPVKAGSLSWSNGQLLQATLVKRDTGSLLMQIGETLVKTLPGNLSSSIGPKAAESIEQFLARLQPGDALNLRMVTVNGQPALKLLLPASDPALTIANALRVALPKQDSLAPLLANLAFTTQANDSSQTKLPAELRQLVDNIIKQLPTTSNIRDADIVRRAILNSGIFVEQQLSQAVSQGDNPLSGDLRIALTRLAALIRTTLPQVATPGSEVKPAPQSVNQSQLGGELPLPPGPAKNPTATSAQLSARLMSPLATLPPPSVARPTPQARTPASLSVLQSTFDALQELFRQTESALARIQSQQLNSASNTDAQRTQLLFELPIRGQDGVDVFQFRIHRDAGNQRNPTQDTPWSVSLAFELERMGPVRVLISLLNQQVSVTFWAETPATQQLFNKHMSALQDNLADAGLTIGRLSCRSGEPDAAEFGRNETPRLMDEHA